MKSYDWNDYQQDLSPVIDRVLLIFALVSFSAVPFQICNSSNVFFGWFNLVSGLLYGCMYLLRRRLFLRVKIAGITILSVINAISSFYLSGLLGTGVIVLLGLQILFVIFYRTTWAIGFICFTLLILMGFGLSVQFDFLVYDRDLIDRLNNGSHWVITILGVGGIAGIAVYAISLVKSRLMDNIHRLETANAALFQQERVLERIAYVDDLTGLLNRKGFYRAVDGWIDQNPGSSALLLIGNIRHFRVINALLGTQRANEILLIVAGILNKYDDSGQIMARLHGDEFVAWFEDWNDDSLEEGVSEFQTALKRVFQEEIPEFPIDILFSVARYPDHGTTPDMCYKNASIALRLAKEKGGSKVEVFHPEMLKTASQDMFIRQALELALEQGNFEVYYQKKVGCNSLETLGVEALARWISPVDSGSASPAMFIPMLHKHSLMVRFGKLIFLKVLSQFRGIQRVYGESIVVSINISPTLFVSLGFADFIQTSLANHKIDPERVTIEITEEVFIDDIATIQETLRRLREIGVGIALDDFGKGFSSLSYISTMPLTEIKIDKSFIEDVVQNSRQLVLVQSICHIAHNLGYSVFAEGVETEDQFLLMKEAGCDGVQGFLFSVPEPLPID